MVVFLFPSCWWLFCTLFRHRQVHRPFYIFCFCFLLILIGKLYFASLQSLIRDFLSLSLFFAFLRSLIVDFLFFFCFPPILIGDFLFSFAFLQSLIEDFLYSFAFWSIFTTLVNETFFWEILPFFLPRVRVKILIPGQSLWPKGWGFGSKRLVEGEAWSMSGYLLRKRFRDKGMPHIISMTRI